MSEIETFRLDIPTSDIDDLKNRRGLGCAHVQAWLRSILRPGWGLGFWRDYGYWCAKQGPLSEHPCQHVNCRPDQRSF